jgi:hypothetical protein
MKDYYTTGESESILDDKLFQPSIRLYSVEEGTRAATIAQSTNPYYFNPKILYANVRTRNMIVHSICETFDCYYTTNRSWHLSKKKSASNESLSNCPPNSVYQSGCIWLVLPPNVPLQISAYR